MNEKYVPLYRKYRPQTLEEVVGQEHIKKALTNAIELNKIAHAYLFTGPRGTGKTSSARILAKSLNCKNGPTVKPCGKCESCIDITNSTPVDVIEIDAASNRKVEDAQNILEKIQYVPVNGKYKIYIIDEVHMLSNTAFNALLKTLEEPPENVIFILATTEPQKVLDTIKSRCQRFDFKRITTEDIVKHLEYISKQEGIKIEKEALYAIAKNSAGGMRDSISLLDQLSVLGTTTTITVDDINSLLGRISFDLLLEISKTIVESNPQESITILEKIYNSGNEPSQILLNMLEFFKNALLVKTCEKNIAIELTQYNDAQIKAISPLVEDLEKHQIVFLIEKISNYLKELKTSTTPHLWLEVALIDLANLTENTKLLDLQERLSRLENGEVKVSATPTAYKTAPMPTMKPIMKPQPKVETPKPEIKEEIKQETVTEEPKVEETKAEEKPQMEDFSPMPKSQSQPTSSSNISELWHTLISNVQSSATQALLKLATPVMITPEKIIITFKSDALVSKFNDVSKKQSLVDACDTLFSQSGSNVIVRMPLPEDGKFSASAQPVQVEKKNPEPKAVAKEIEQKKEIKPQPKKEVETAPIKEKPNTEEKKENSDNTNKEEKNDEKISVDKTLLSDQVKMVVQLFDGKEIL